TDAEADYHRSSQVLAFARLRTGRPGKLPRPTHDLSEVPPQVMAGVDEALSCAAIGSPASVATALKALIARYKPDEIMLTGMIHDHQARLKSFKIAANVIKAINPSL
ncbi:MAG: alkane 1-monooxygenase, partial [Pseudorhodobacter sp.]|nr:alkane 1-monooxygenase [Pseudorhodobacter sp.]